MTEKGPLEEIEEIVVAPVRRRYRILRKALKLSAGATAGLVILALIAATLVYFRGEEFLRADVEARASRALGRAVTLAKLDVDVPRRSVELTDLVVPGGPSSKRPTARVPRARIALSFRSLLSRDFWFRGIDLERPEFSIEVAEDGSTDVPAPTGEGGEPGVRVRIDRLSVQGGRFYLNDHAVPIEVDLPSFDGKVEPGARRGALKGTLSAGPGPLRFAGLAPQEARLSVPFEYAESKLAIGPGTFEARVTRATLSGALDFAPAPSGASPGGKPGPRGAIVAAGTVDLSEVEKSFIGSDLGLSGQSQSRLTFEVRDGRVALSADVSGERGAFSGLQIDRFKGAVRVDRDGVALRGLDLAAYGGTAKGDASVDEKGATAIAFALEAVETEPLLRWVLGWGALDLGARATGSVQASWEKGGNALWNGSGQFAFVAPHEGAGGERDPVNGRIRFTSTKGVFRVDESRLQLPATNVTWSGTIDPSRRVATAVALDTTDLARTDALALRFRRATGAADPQLLGAVGRGRLEGRVTGTLDEPVFAGRFAGQDVRFFETDWGAIDWRGEATPLEVKSERLVATRRDSRLELEGTQRLGASGVDDGWNLSVDILSWPAVDLLKLAASDLEFEGDVAGRVTLTGTRASPDGRLQLRATQGKAFSVPFRSGSIAADLLGARKVVRVREGSARVGGGLVTFSGEFPESDAAAWSGEARFTNVEIADLGPSNGAAGTPAGTAGLGGAVSGEARFGGTRERPTVDARLESKRLFYGDEGIGAAAATVRGDGSGRLAVRASLESARFHATAEGSVGATRPYPATLSFELRDARLDPVLRAGQGAQRLETAVHIVASATGTIEGPLAQPADLVARIRGGRARVASPEYVVEAAPDFSIDIAQGTAQISRLAFSGESTALTFTGRVALDERGEHDLAIGGRADLRVLSAFRSLRDWRTRGTASLRARLRGTSAAPRLTGGVDIEDAAVRLKTFPQGIDALRGRVTFSETSAQVIGLEGRFGGGRVSISGQGFFGGASDASFDLALSGQSLGLRYPEGLRATGDASLRLYGSARAQWLTGDVRLSQAVWSRRYDIADEWLQTDATMAAAAESATRLDIRIHAPGTLRVDNNLAQIFGRAELTLSGTPSEPVLLGRAEVERGRVVFRGNAYELRKGVLDFSNPREINPVFDIEAETRIRSYRLTLQAQGTVDRVSSRITSDPPLTSLQIASLLSGADENDLAVAARSTDLAQAQVASVVADRVSGPVAEGFGLSRLSIAPANLREGLSLGNARLTVGKRVTPNLEVLYSWDTGGQRGQLATVEYTLTDRFSLVLTRAEPGGYGIDVRTRFTLAR